MPGQPVASGSSQFAALDHSLVFSDLPCARFCVLLAVSMDDETLACYVSSEEEAGQQPQRVKAQPGKAPSQLAPGWLNPSPGSQAGQKKQEKAYPAWTMTRPSSSGIPHTPAHRGTMTSTASAMAVAQALAKAAESAALATKRAADTIQLAGARLGKQGALPEEVARPLGPATGESATSAGSGRGCRGGRGRGCRGGRGGRRGRGSSVLRSDDDVPTAILPANATPPPKMTRSQRQAKKDEAEEEAEEEEDPFHRDEAEGEEDPFHDEDEQNEMDVPTEEYEDYVEDDARAGMAQATNSSAFPSASSTASAEELAVAAASHARQQEQKRQAEAKAKTKKKAQEKAEEPPPKKKGRGEGPQKPSPKAAAGLPEEKSAPRPESMEAPAPEAEGGPKTEGAPPEILNLPATFAGRHPPQNALGAARFRSEQQQWYTVRGMWANQGLKDAMNNNDSQRSFYERMRKHIRLTDEHYDEVAPQAWQAWEAEHPVLSKS